MASFEYYATFDESIEILRDLMNEHDLFVIPDRRAFDEPEAETYNTVNDALVAELRKRRAVFLGGNFTRNPMGVKKFNSGPYKGKYYVSEGIGGPVLQFILAVVNVVDNIPTLVPGSLSYIRYYYDTSTEEYEAAPPELQKAHKDIVRTMRKHLVSVKHDGKNIFIGPGALKQLQAGQVRILGP